MIEHISPARADGRADLPGSQILPDDRGCMVGPFALLATHGPFTLPPGFPRDFDVRSHMHFGMAALAYIMAGEVTHRDGLGNNVRHMAGAASWMVAGSGLVHSERLETLRAAGGDVQALVAWLALPEEEELRAPSFRLCPQDTLPPIGMSGANGRLVLGEARRHRSPALPSSPAYLIHWNLDAGAEMTSFAEHRERALHVVSGPIEAGGRMIATGETATLTPGRDVPVRALGPATLVEFGGAPVGERYLWWNFVASRPDLIEAAKRRWADQAVPMPPGETEFIPMPTDAERPLLRLHPYSMQVA